MAELVHVPHRGALPDSLLAKRSAMALPQEVPTLYDEAKAYCAVEYEAYRGRADIQASVLNQALDDVSFVHEVAEASRRVDGLVVESPLFEFDDLTGKDESVQQTRSFKLRGAANFILKREAEALEIGLLTASAGNHGQGVALVAAKLGCRATVVVPENTPRVKTDGISDHGATVVRFGRTYEDAAAHAVKLTQSAGALYVPAYEHRDVMAGQATIGQELLRQTPYMTDVVVAAGGLGLLAGVSRYLGYYRPDVRVWGSGLAGYSAAAVSLRSYKPETIADVDMLADGVATKTVGTLTLSVARRFTREILGVERPNLQTAMAALDDAGHRAEGAGALPFAAALAHRAFLGNNVVCLLSGGNVDQSTLDDCRRAV